LFKYGNVQNWKIYYIQSPKYWTHCINWI